MVPQGCHTKVPGWSSRLSHGGNQEEIKRVIESAYIEGVHTTQDEQTVRAGFDDEFRMFVNTPAGVEPVDISSWMRRVGGMKKAKPELWGQPTTVAFDSIDVTGDSAVAVLAVHKGDTYFSTDYMLLYRLDEGWRIVAKVFTTEVRSP